MRPVLSMPGSAFYKVAKQVAFWLSQVPECQIQCSTKTICDSLKKVKLDDGEILVSFDVSSLYTNVPVMEAINRCADLLFQRFMMCIDKDTFITLAQKYLVNYLSPSIFYLPCFYKIMDLSPQPQVSSECQFGF